MNKRQKLKIEIATQILANSTDSIGAVDFALDKAESLLSRFEYLESLDLSDKKEDDEDDNG